MKLAHLILAHNNPQQLARLVQRLCHPDADIYIHLDAKTDAASFEQLKHLPNTHFIEKRVNMMWGEYSTIQGTLNGMEEILTKGNKYSHINLLSGNDYPLRKAKDIQDFLFANEGKSFMWYDQIFDSWIHGQVRVNTYYFGDYGFPGRYHLAAVINKILPKRRLPLGLTAYGRSQWLTITPEAAAYAIKYVKDNPAAERFFRMTWAVDEIFFQTILCNSPLRDTIINNDLRHIRLQANYRPVVFTLADADVLLSSDKFYARKFDRAVDEAIFDQLDHCIV